MSDGSEIAGWVGGAAGSGALVVALVKWLGGRVVQREDDDRKTLQTKLEETQRTNSSIEKSLIGLQHDMSSMRLALEQMSRQVEMRAIAQDKEIAELRTEFKEQINQLEHRLRSDMQRLVKEPRSKRA